MSKTTTTTTAAPTKRPARQSPLGVSFAILAGLAPNRNAKPTAPARPAAAPAASKPRPTGAARAAPAPATAMSVPKPAVTKRTAVAMPVPEVKAAPKRICFAHLAGDHSGEPLLALPAAQAPAPAAVNTTPKTDPAAIDSQWDLAHRKAASFLPVARAGRDAVARRWDRLMQAAMGRR